MGWVIVWKGENVWGEKGGAMCEKTPPPLCAGYFLCFVLFVLCLVCVVYVNVRRC